MLFRPPTDRHVQAIAERVRAMLSRQPGRSLRALSESLCLPAEGLAQLLMRGDRGVDRAFLIDTIAALAYEAGVDPHWLLTGEYDSASHRHVLLLGEDRSANGASAMRDLVHQQYRRLRRDALFAWRPLRKSSAPVVAKPRHDR